MSNIHENLQKILHAVWGKDVRQAIHDAIHDCYEDGSAGSTDLIAREEIEELEAIKATRIELAEETADRLAEVAVERGRIDNLVTSGTGVTNATKRTETTLFSASVPCFGNVSGYSGYFNLEDAIENYDYIKIRYNAFGRTGIVDCKPADISASGTIGSTVFHWSEIQPNWETTSLDNPRTVFRHMDFSAVNISSGNTHRLSVDAVVFGWNGDATSNGKISDSFAISWDSSKSLYVASGFAGGIYSIIGVKYTDAGVDKDTELTDIRTGADGTVYQTAGGAVRGQIEDITNRLDGVESNFGDEYDSTATYAVGDRCVYGGVWYECNTAISTAEDWTEAHWDKVSLADITDQVAQNTAGIAENASDIQELKEELNFNVSVISNIADKRNMLEGALFHTGGYYYGRFYEDSRFVYAIISVESGVSYTFLGVRFLSKEDEWLLSNGSPSVIKTYTPEYTGEMYVSFGTSQETVWFCKTTDYQLRNYGSLKSPVLNPSVFKRLSEASSSPASVDLITRMTRSIAEHIFDGNLLFGAEVYDGVYYYNASFYTNNDSVCFVIHVENGVSYTINKGRFITTRTENISESGQEIVYVATFTGDLYISVNKTNLADAYVYKTSEFDPSNHGTYGNPLYNSSLFSNEYSEVANKALTPKVISDMFPIMDGTDLCGAAELTEGKYAYSNNDHIAFATNASFSYYKLAATEGRYTFSEPARFVVATDASGNTLLYLGGTGSQSSYINCPEGTEYLYVSFSNTHIETAKIGRGALTPTATKYYGKDVVTESLSSVDSKIYGKGFFKQTGTLSDGSTWSAPITNVKKNNIYSFLAKVSSFNIINIGHGKNVYDSAYLEITTEKVIEHRYHNSAESAIEHNHGLTIQDYLYVQIIVKEGVADVKLYSNKATYELTNISWDGDGNAASFVENAGSTLSDCTFTWSSQDFRKSVWMFGDSYFGFTGDSRWVYYLINSGYGDNVLLNAFPGENTSAALTALNNMINEFGKPQFIIWCLGMNDGADTDVNTPSTAWKNGYDTIIAICEIYGITPIFATIPTVPTINHEGKNKFVRESGERYIDFAKAVGAQSNGTWYSGMLSSDGVHPSSEGAKALYYQAIADAPEITYSNP